MARCERAAGPSQPRPTRWHLKHLLPRRRGGQGISLNQVKSELGLS
jgi:hypothetical protein